MKLKPISKITTKTEARSIAMDYQNWSAEHSMGWSEVAEYGNYFEALGKKFKLIKEFKAMTDYSLSDIKINNERGWERVCKKCGFVIPEHEWVVFGDCGQCGSKQFRKDKIKKQKKVKKIKGIIYAD